MTETREIQASSLSERIRQIEEVLKQGALPALEFLLKGELLNQKAQLAEIREDDFKAETKREEKARDAVQIASMVAVESKLNAEEKLRYSELLKKDYFTEADVAQLDDFFEKSYDKLSDPGKREISERLWEGIERGELEFTDLATETRKKEAEFLYRCLNGDAKVDHPLQSMPDEDKADFIRAYEAKDEKAVSEVLSRKSVSQHVGRSASNEADSIKGSASVENGEQERAQKTSSAQEIAFGSEATPVNPNDLPRTGGTRSI